MYLLFVYIFLIIQVIVEIEINNLLTLVSISVFKLTSFELTCDDTFNIIMMYNKYLYL